MAIERSFLAYLLHPVGPDRVGQVRPVVFARVERFPARLQILLPLGQAEQFPERAGGDEHAVVQVRLEGQAGHAQQFVVKFLQLNGKSSSASISSRNFPVPSFSIWPLAFSL